MSKKEHDNLDPALDALLRRLPDRSVPSNFSFRVLQAVESKQFVAQKPTLWWKIIHHPVRLISQAAVGAMALCLGLFGYQHYEATTQMKMAESVVTVAQVSSLPSPDLLRDFEAVRHLNTTPAADEELLTLLQ